MNLKNLSATKIPKLLKNKLTNKRINQIYKKFEQSIELNENFAVAVSGGPDSLALAFLSKVYSIKKRISPKFFIVDHKLRPESTKEAKLVIKILKKYSINAKILTWQGKKPIKNIQSLARNERLKLLFAECDKYKINSILFGQHQDDLLENFFLRLFRGSGLKGLISLDKINKFENKNLLRPLLDLKKSDLIFVSKQVFDFYVSDLSNKDEKYHRVRIRKLIEDLQKSGLDKKNFLKTIKNLKYSKTIVDFYVNENLRKNTFLESSKNRLILNKEFFKQPKEVVFRSFSDLVKSVGKKYYSARGKKLDKIINDIESNSLSKATLGGCIIKKVNQTVIISKEY